MKDETLSAREAYESMGKAFIDGLIAGLKENEAIDAEKEKE